MLRHHDNYIIFTKKTLIKFMVGVIEKKSKKRKGESSISERESAAEKRKRNGHDNQDKSETQKFLDDVSNNLMNMDDLRNNHVTHVKTTIINSRYTKITQIKKKYSRHPTFVAKDKSSSSSYLMKVLCLYL